MKRDRDATWQALNVAFYALCEQLEQAGALDQAKLADEIMRFHDDGKPVLNANLEGIAATLRNRPFGPNRLDVIEGGRQD